MRDVLANLQKTKEKRTMFPGHPKYAPYTTKPPTGKTKAAPVNAPAKSGPKRSVDASNSNHIPLQFLTARCVCDVDSALPGMLSLGQLMQAALAKDPYSIYLDLHVQYGSKSLAI